MTKKQYNELLNELSGDYSKNATMRLIELSSDRKAYVRYFSIDSLFGRRGKLVMETLIRASKDKNSSVRGSAVEALVYFNNLQSKHALLDALDDKDQLTRVYAVENLGCLKYTKAIPKIIKLLEKDTFLVRAYAAYSLGEMGCIIYKKINILELLYSRLKKDRSRYVHIDIIAALYKLGEQEILSNLTQFLTDPDLVGITVRTFEKLADKTNANIILDLLSKIDNDIILPHEKSDIKDSIAEIVKLTS